MIKVVRRCSTLQRPLVSDFESEEKAERTSLECVPKLAQLASLQTHRYPSSISPQDLIVYEEKSCASLSIRGTAYRLFSIREGER